MGFFSNIAAKVGSAIKGAYNAVRNAVVGAWRNVVRPAAEWVGRKLGIESGVRAACDVVSEAGVMAADALGARIDLLIDKATAAACRWLERWFERFGEAWRRLTLGDLARVERSVAAVRAERKREASVDA